MPFLIYSYCMFYAKCAAMQVLYLSSMKKSHKKVCFDISFHSHQPDKTKSSETGLSTKQRLVNISKWMFGHFCRFLVPFCKAKEMSLIISSGSIMFNFADLHDINSVLRKNTNEHGPFRPCP